MLKIEMITDEQKSMLSSVAEEWLKIGLSTEPAERTAAEYALMRFYSMNRLKLPNKFIWKESPREGMIEASLWDHSCSGPEYPSKIGNLMAEEVKDKLVRKINKQISGGVDTYVTFHVCLGVWESIALFLCGQVYRALTNHIKETVFERHFVIHNNMPWIAGYGLHYANGMARYDAFSRLGVDVREVVPLMDLAKSAGWWWRVDDTVIITERPCELHRDQFRRLHSTTGMAIRYPDGYGLYFIHGVNCPPWLVEEPERLTVDIIRSESNIALRTIMMGQFGTERYIYESGSKPIYIDEYGTLYRVNINGEEPITMVEVVNGTPEPDGEYKRYMLRVPPTMRTAREAVAWTYGMSPGEYELVVRT